MKNLIQALWRTIIMCTTVGFLTGCGGGGGSGGNSGNGVSSSPYSAAISSSSTISSSSQSTSSDPIILKPVALQADVAPNPALPSRDSADWSAAADASRFLARTSFGATAKDIDFIVKNGKEAWLDKQFSLRQTSQLTFLDKRLRTYGMVPVTPEMYFDDYSFERTQYQHNIWMETSIWGEDQLRYRVAFALSQILVVSGFGSNQFARERGFANYIDILGRGAFGNYGTLLTDITLNPIMGLYLNTLNNPKADLSKNIRPDENYAREVLQLFSIGLNELNVDGTLKLDKNGNPIPTFNQDIIKEFSRIFTGWSYSANLMFAQNGPSKKPEIATPIYPAAISNVDPLKPFEDFHDNQAKTLLNGEVIPAGNTAQQDIDAAMKNIMQHNNVGPFICKILIQYLVTSNPTPAYVARVAHVFNDNGSGVKGDMKAVVKAIYLDDEALNPPAESATFFGKRKETPLMLSGIWRAFRAQGVYVKGPVVGAALSMAHNHYDVNDEQEMLLAASVFNFYQSNYSPPGLLANKNILAPEFQPFNESLAVYQTNLLTNIIFHRHIDDKNMYIDAPGEMDGFVLTGDLYDPVVKARLNLTEELALASKPAELVDRINLLLTHGVISKEDSALIVNHLNLIDDPLERVYEAIFLIAVSPEYAIQG